MTRTVTRSIRTLSCLAALGGATVAMAQGTKPGAEPPPPSREELRQRLDVLAQELDRMKMGGAGAKADRSDYGLGAAASKVYRADPGVSVGGYGEFIFRHASRVGPGETRPTDTFNFERAVLYVGYKFDEHWIWNSELEVENATTEAGGAVSLEFGYLDRLIAPEVNLRVGSVLVPLGWLNELHEPTIFLGVRRPEVETRLIPTTWGENGAGVFGSIGPITYKSYVVAGLNASRFEVEGIREGRQKGAESKAATWASASRVDVSPVAGLEAGVAVFVGASTTDEDPARGGGLAVPTQIIDVHADWRLGGLQARALAVMTTLREVDRLDRARNLGVDESVGSKQQGAYVEVGYDVASAPSTAVVPFVRWEAIDTQAAVPAGYRRDPAFDVRSITAGVNYQPIDQIVFKVDYRAWRDGTSSLIRDEFDAGAGYVF